MEYDFCNEEYRCTRVNGFSKGGVLHVIKKQKETSDFYLSSSSFPFKRETFTLIAELYAETAS